MEGRRAPDESLLAAQGGSMIPAAVDEAEALSLPVPGPETGSGTGAGPFGLDSAEQHDTAREEPKPRIPTDRVPVASLPSRPAYRREQSVPASPQHLPPPAPPSPTSGNGEPGGPTDSLTLMQLRNLVREMPRVEPAPYAFEYRDASSFTDEFEEWFTYKKEEQADVLETHAEFKEEWETFCGFGEGGAHSQSQEAVAQDWTAADIEQRTEFCHRMLSGLQQSDGRLRHRSLHALAYLALGTWHETAGVSGSEVDAVDGTKREGKKKAQEDEPATEPQESVDNEVQTSWIKGNIRLVVLCEGVQAVYDVFRDLCLRAW